MDKAERTARRPGVAHLPASDTHGKPAIGVGMVRPLQQRPQGPLRVHAIVNPISGRPRRRRALFALLEDLRGLRHDLSLRITRRPGDAEHFARAACASGCDLIVAGGGDGTVREVAAGLRGGLTSGLRKIAPPVLIAPAGTENVLARCLGLAPDENVLAGALRDWDLVELDTGECNGRPFVVVLGVGFDAEVVCKLAGGRRGHISYWDYLAPIWTTLLHYHHPRIVVEADGDVVFDDCGLAILGHLPRYALGLRVLERADPRDGRMDVIAFRCDGAASLLRHAVRVVMGTHVNAPGVVYRQARHVRIRSAAPVPYEIDGDPGGLLPIDVRVSPLKVTFLRGIRSGFMP